MKITIGGKTFTNFVSGSVTTMLNALARDFELTAATKGVGDIPFRKGQTVQIALEPQGGDERIFNGHIETIKLAGSEKDIKYTISGRDLLGDLIDSNLESLGDTGVTVAAACRVVLSHLGIKVRVIDLANTSARPFFDSLDIVAPDPSDAAGQFLADLARRRQALLTSDGDANLVITQGIGQSIKSKLINHLDGKGNNLLTWNYETSDEQRYGVYTTDAQLNVAAVGSVSPAAPLASEIVGITAAFRDPAIRSSRQRSIASEESYGAADAAQRSKWDANLSRAEGNRYSVTVHGFFDQEGNTWKNNFAPIVHDEFAGISARMLIKGVRYQFDESGEVTELQLTERDAYTSALPPIDEGYVLGP